MKWKTKRNTVPWITENKRFWFLFVYLLMRGWHLVQETNTHNLLSFSSRAKITNEIFYNFVLARTINLFCACQQIGNRAIKLKKDGGKAFVWSPNESGLYFCLALCDVFLHEWGKKNVYYQQWDLRHNRVHVVSTRMHMADKLREFHNHKSASS